MSASLVGSEMCIRDRLPRKHRSAHLHHTSLDLLDEEALVELALGWPQANAGGHCIRAAHMDISQHRSNVE
eukprot:10973941-Alexandrium_andersonii.AAC.1